MPQDKKLKFSIDTSSLIQAWSRAYPPDSFPTFWERMSGLVEQKVLITPDVVLTELEKKDDGLHQWAKEHKENLFYPMDIEIQKIAKEMLSKFPRLIDSKRGRSGADPFVIALAKMTDRAVVTNELMGKPQKPSIVDVCNEYNIECMNLLDMIRRLGLKF